jgi:hypothetical protein
LTLPYWVDVSCQPLEHGRALRGVADRLLGIACTLLQRQTLFDPEYGTPAAP